jgi:hypothetical protein
MPRCCKPKESAEKKSEVKKEAKPAKKVTKAKGAKK